MQNHPYQAAIQACLRCASICNYCSSECLKEEHLHMMAKCVQLDQECAAVCYATAQLLSLGSEKAKSFAQLCARFCRDCAEECGKHDHEHCQLCAEACTACAVVCEQLD